MAGGMPGRFLRPMVPPFLHTVPVSQKRSPAPVSQKRSPAGRGGAELRRGEALRRRITG